MYETTVYTYIDDMYVDVRPVGTHQHVEERASDLPLLLDDEQESDLPPLIDVTPIEHDCDLTWSRWLADADAWLGGPDHHIAASSWLDHILAAWESPRRIFVATQVLAVLSHNTTARSRRAGPVLHFIAASFWADPRPDGRLHLAGAYRGASDLTTHAILTARAVLNK